MKNYQKRLSRICRSKIMKKYGLFPDLRGSGEWLSVGSDETDTTDWIYLGKLTEYGKKYKVKFDVTKEKVIAIVGKRGQGKSYTLASLLEGLISDKNPSSISSISNRRSILLFDTLNIFQWMNIRLDKNSKYPVISEQAGISEGWDINHEQLNVDVWAPAGFKHDLANPNHKDLYLDVTNFTINDWGALLNLDTIRDIKGQYLSEIFYKVTLLGWQDENNKKHAPKIEYNIQDLIDCIQTDEENESGIYKSETRRAVLQQLISYSKYELFSSNGTPLNQILKKGHCAIILMNMLPEDLRNVVVATIIRRVTQERAEASENAKDLMVNTDLSKKQRELKEAQVKTAIPKTWIVIDEAQNVIPSRNKTIATDSIVKLVREGRNFGLSFIVTTQQPRALDFNVLSQVETFIIHKLVSQADIDYVLDNIKCPLPKEIKDDESIITLKELIRDIGLGQVVVSDTNSMRCFVMAVRPRVSVHGGFEA